MTESRSKTPAKAKPKPSIRLMRIIKRVYYRFLRIRGGPRQISLGLALGIFIGMTPFLGFHTVIAVMLAAVFGWSKIAAGAGVFITNPITAPLIYPLTYKLGAMMTGLSDSSQWRKLFESDGIISLVKNSPMILVDLLIGGVVVGLPLAVIVYYFAFNAVTQARKRMALRKTRRITRRAAVLKKSRREAEKRPVKPSGTDHL